MKKYVYTLKELLCICIGCFTVGFLTFGLFIIL